SYSDPPTALRLPYSSARPARSAHSPPAPDPPASPLTSFPQSPFSRTSRSGRYPAAATAPARGYTSTFPSAAPRSRLPAAPAAACNSIPSLATRPPARRVRLLPREPRRAQPPLAQYQDEPPFLPRTHHHRLQHSLHSDRICQFGEQLLIELPPRLVR